MDRRLVLVIAAGVASCDRLFGVTDFRSTPLADARPDAPDAPGPCGYIGETCCNAVSCLDGTQCITGASGSRCLAFAGTFQTTPPNACAAPECLLANPITGACSCPAGVSETANLDEGCGADAIHPANVLGLGELCGISTLPPESDWGGAFLSSDIAACEPNTSPPNCMMVNPITQACSCPQGAEVLALRVFVPGVVGTGCANTFLGGTLGVCLMPNAPITSLAGVFEQDAAGTCKVHSPSLAGCACPSGSIASQLRTLQEDGTTVQETAITFCVIAP